MKKYIYYAHHLYKYDTKVEEYEKSLIQRELPQYKILDPNGDIMHQDLTNDAKIMEKCLSEIEREDVGGVVFSSLSGVVGLGVFQEVNHAISLGKEVYYIKDNKALKCNFVVFEETGEGKRFFAIVTKNK